MLHHLWFHFYDLEWHYLEWSSSLWKVVCVYTNVYTNYVESSSSCYNYGYPCQYIVRCTLTYLTFSMVWWYPVTGTTLGSWVWHLRQPKYFWYSSIPTVWMPLCYFCFFFLAVFNNNSVFLNLELYPDILTLDSIIIGIASLQTAI